MSDNQEVKTGNFGKSSPGRRTVLLILIAGFVAFAAVGWSVWRYYDDAQSSKQKASEVAQQKARLEAAETYTDKTAEQAAAALKNNSATELDAVYTKAIQGTNDSYTKAKLYTEYAQSLATLKQYQQALEKAQKALEYDTDRRFSPALYPFMAYVAQQLGNKELQLEYLKKTYQAVQQKQIQEVGELEAIQQEINALEQSK